LKGGPREDVEKKQISSIAGLMDENFSMTIGGEFKGNFEGYILC
jgi:hypothetical protein